MSFHTMPIWDCPSCSVRQQADDYCDLTAGDRLTCRRCEKEFEIESVETVMEVQLKDKP